MRVLWLCNIMLPAFAKAKGLPFSNREGWLTGCYERITAGNASRAGEGWIGAVRRPSKWAAIDEGETVELGVCMPVPENLSGCREEIDGAVFYGFAEDLNTPEVYKPELERRFQEILEDYCPDLVHIFGTEFPHALAMTRAFRRPERTLIGIQGVCAVIAEEYMAELPYKERRKRTFRDRVRHDSLKEQQEKFRKRAEYEKEALQGTLHVTGRTAFDRDAAARIHPEASYHHMNETLRPTFYGPRWDLNSAEPHSIFLSQGDYPLKGFHFVLQAMPQILKEYPDTQVYIAGNSIIGNVGGILPKKTLPEPVWITSYGRYLKKLIRQGGLDGHVTMLGPLTAEEMLSRYRRSHIFLCPSINENSPNSLCEAMLLGMPTAASNVGGISSLVENGSEGLLFPGGNAQALAEAVCSLFGNDQFACRLGSEAHKEAMIRHNPDTNYQRLIGIYRAICL